MEENNQAKIQYQYDDLTALRQKNPQEYSPDQEQILEYAQYIGIQLPQDIKLLYIAKEGIVAQLPSEWEACQTKQAQIVYRNKMTKVVQEEHPLDQYYRQKVLQAKNIMQTNRNLQFYDQNLNSNDYNEYYDVEFDFKPISQLPSIQEDRNELNESDLSEKMNLNFNLNQRQDQISSNSFNQNKKKSKLLFSSLYSNNKSKVPSSISLANKISSNQEWNSALDKNIQLSNSQAFQSSQNSQNSYNKRIKTKSVQAQLHESEYAVSLQQNKNKIQVQFQNYSNRILPSSIEQGLQDQDQYAIGQGSVNSKQFSDKFQVHKEKHEQNLNIKKVYEQQHKISLNKQIPQNKINPANNSVHKNENRPATKLKDKQQMLFQQQKEQQAHLNSKQQKLIKAKLIETLSNLEEKHQLQLQLLSQLQQNNKMKMQKITKKLNKLKNNQKSSKNKKNQSIKRQSKNKDSQICQLGNIE